MNNKNQADNRYRKDKFKNLINKFDSLLVKRCFLKLDCKSVPNMLDIWHKFKHIFKLFNLLNKLINISIYNGV